MILAIFKTEFPECFTHLKRFPNKELSIQVNQMEMAQPGNLGRGGSQSMIKHLMQDKEMNMRRQLLNKVIWGD